MPEIIDVNGTTSYNRTFLYAGLKRNQIGSRGQDTHWEFLISGFLISGIR